MTYSGWSALPLLVSGDRRRPAAATPACVRLHWRCSRDLARRPYFMRSTLARATAVSAAGTCGTLGIDRRSWAQSGMLRNVRRTSTTGAAHPRRIRLTAHAIQRSDFLSKLTGDCKPPGADGRGSEHSPRGDPGRGSCDCSKPRATVRYHRGRERQPAWAADHYRWWEVQGANCRARGLRNQCGQPSRRLPGQGNAAPPTFEAFLSVGFKRPDRSFPGRSCAG